MTEQEKDNLLAYLADHIHELEPYDNELGQCTTCYDLGFGIYDSKADEIQQEHHWAKAHLTTCPWLVLRTKLIGAGFKIEHGDGTIAVTLTTTEPRRVETHEYRP